MRTIEELKQELLHAASAGISAGERGDLAGLAAAEEQAVQLELQLKALERESAIRGLGGIREYGASGGLASALEDAGWNRKTRTSVTVDNPLRFKTGSVDGGVAGNEVVDVFTAPALGIDARYIYSHVRTQGVNGDDTGVMSYRQNGRTLGTPSNMIQAIDYTSAKEETDSQAEVVNEPLYMIANVETGTPNILLANPSFRSWVNNDLLAAYRAALDFHIVDQVNGASIPTGGGGNNVFEDVLYSQEVVRAAGYSPDLVVLSPADALAIQLLVMSSGDTYAFNQTAPSMVISPSVDDGNGFVCDSQALGILFLGPFTFAAFEEANGTTNTSTVRGESSGLFLVQRADAAATLAAS